MRKSRKRRSSPGPLIKDWKSLPLGREKYQCYLASREWAVLKEAVKARSGGRCERCGAPGTQVHHQTYERLYAEPLEDLLHVCGPCHEFLSGKRDADPALSIPVVAFGRTINRVFISGPMSFPGPRISLPDGRSLPFLRSVDFWSSKPQLHCYNKEYKFKIIELITSCDLFFGWIGSINGDFVHVETQHTLLEIGLAAGIKLPVVFGWNPEESNIRDHISLLCDLVLPAHSPLLAWDRFWLRVFGSEAYRP